MPLQRLTLDHISSFGIGFSLLGTTEYPQASFTVANVHQYWVQQNTHRPLCYTTKCDTMEDGLMNVRQRVTRVGREVNPMLSCNPGNVGRNR
jgi:hypothetical protein